MCVSKRSTAGMVKAEWTHVAESQGEAVLFFFHGGGYIFGAPRTHRTLVANICKARGLKGFSIDYRLFARAPGSGSHRRLRDSL
jgi:monoterpene epsilon-lactone hydrolase